ncbi:MAG: UDP-2,3-diacylglucosamine pyrophosphatase [Acidocella sp. 20-57-95]|nr:MAG: UDP-2,3-diacylglucosamine pyrophosphatase [Acidocella sp. 20-57-95]OYV59740.1 MAG: UDP-2,3-diacylglucosamine pyrophosphatase [Acidocella sp. 21-58-7]HQT64436.1 UDP-2,3-diacylglucosamine diphosphatase LpxI [Acidocella sp.]HQU04684.1 UDP-2,3-diacylglucosamine diphosphatase LpxI [Acidocella sp.]
MAAPLGIIAGGGPLPGRVAEAAKAAGRPVFVAALEGFADPTVVGNFEHQFFRLGAIGAIRQALKERFCTDIVMIGPVKRPSMLALRPDAEGLRLVGKIGKAAFAGDDGLLAAIIRVLSEDGFRVLGAHDILSDVLGPAGLLTATAPDATAMADVQRGAEVLRFIGPADIGQSCVVQQGIVLAVEAVEGTDAMLGRIPSVARSGPGGVLVKLAKPGQERRVDLPTIGPDTIRNAHKAGLRGIAFEAGNTILSDRAEMIAAAEAAGLFLLGIETATGDIA